MPLGVKVNVTYNPEMDQYRFTVTTPDIFYRTRPNLALSLASDYSKPVSFPPVHMAPGIKVAVMVNPDMMIEQWSATVHVIIAYVEKHMHDRYADIIGMHPDQVFSILKMVQDELMTKQPHEWLMVANTNGGTHAVREQDKLLELMPDLKKKFPCPATDDALQCSRIQELWGLVQHLNDSHEWTREAIADWLDSLDANLYFPSGEPDEG